MKLFDIYKFAVALFLVSGLSGAISVSCSSDGGEGASSISMSYDLDSSTNLAQSTTFGDGWISSMQSLKGSGTNKIAQTVGNEKSSVTSSISSTGVLSSAGSGYASTNAVSVGHNTQTIGQSESAVSGTIDSASASQKSGVLDGSMASSQVATAAEGTVSALQSWNIAGALGYADGEAKLPGNIAQVTGGLNGIGEMSGFMDTKAFQSASASGSFQADSFESKAYSAAKSTSADGDAYSYLSSSDLLVSSLSASADGHVISDQDLNANGDVLVYAASTSDDSSSKSYDSGGEIVSGRISASAGSPAVIETDLTGDIATTSAGFVPTPGSWVRNGLGGIIASNPYALQVDGKSHIFAKGADNGLWDNVDGDWRGLGGILTSDPYAVKDGQGKVHVLARGGDGALWDRILDGGWVGQGGYITSNPSGALSQDNKLKVVVKGGDNSLWMKDLTTGVWSNLGGQIASNPQAIFDNKGKMHVLASGGDGSLWDNVDGSWQSRGGFITSDAKPVLNPFNPGFIYTMARGGDGNLWSNVFNTNSNTATWQGLGGSFNGNPAPAVDTDGVIHTFVRGGDGALWDNANGGRYNLGGSIASDPSAIRDKNGRLVVAARGGDNALWTTTLGINQPPTSLVGPIASDYKNIQAAINAAPDGGTVKVMSGTYKENVNLRKKLTLQGVDTGSGKPVVDANFKGNAITIFSDGQGTISGFKAINADKPPSGSIWAGIYVNSNNNILKNNELANNYLGAFVWQSGSNEFTGNYIHHNAGGIAPTHSNSNTISGNSILYNYGYGICLGYSNDNIIEGNDLSLNSADGIDFGGSNNYNNIVRNNQANYNGLNGFAVGGSYSNLFTGNSVSHNGQTGISIGDGSTGNTVSGNTASYNAAGIGIYFDAKNNNIVGNTMTNNGNGIDLIRSSSNTITDNIIGYSQGSGISMGDNANSNIFARNNIHHSVANGIYMEGSSSNTITDSKFEFNQQTGIALINSNSNTFIRDSSSQNAQSGIATVNSNGNRFYLNNFVNNGGALYSQSSASYWNSPSEVGYVYKGNHFTKLVGNYWSNYGGLDSNGDGIGDTAYQIGSERDSYPLKSPQENYQ